MVQKYEKSRIAVDMVILSIHEGGLKVYLEDREKVPFTGKKELPGGLLRPDETAEQTLERKLKQVLGKGNIFFTQFYTFTGPKRDPRERTVSIGFIALVNENVIKDHSCWYSADVMGLAFDHKDIVMKAREYLKNNINSLIVSQFLPKEFPLNKLQEAYEVIEDKKYDNRNFRKKMISSGIVVESDKMEENVSHRPAKLFKFA